MVIVGLFVHIVHILYILTGRRSWDGFRYFIARFCVHLIQTIPTKHSNCIMLI